MLLFIILIAFIIVAAGLAWYFVYTDRGAKEPIGALWVAFGLGFLGAIAATVIEGFVIGEHDLTSSQSIQNALLVALAIGVIEEACKFLPVTLFIYRKPYFNEHTDGVVYFALAGLGFGLPENILYTVQYGATTGVGRLLMTPLFHAATTGIIGYFLIKRKLHTGSTLAVVVSMFAVMLLHALYDFGLTSGITLYIMMSVLIALGLSASLFIVYWRAKMLDERMGLSSVGHNSFCRSCGKPNANHNLYCTSCGQRA